MAASIYDKQGPSTGRRIAQGLGAGLQQAGQVITDWAKIQEQSRQFNEKLALEKEQLAQQREQAEERKKEILFAGASTRLSAIEAQVAAGNPNLARKMARKSSPFIQDAYRAFGVELDLSENEKEFDEQFKSLAQINKYTHKLLRGERLSVDEQNDVTNLATAFPGADKQINLLMAKQQEQQLLRDADRRKQEEFSKLGVRGPGGEAITDPAAFTAAKAAGLEAQPSEGGGFQLGPKQKAGAASQFKKEQSKLDAKSFAEDLKSLPKLDMQTDNIDGALKLLDQGVKTGKVVGSRVGSAIQEAASGKFQQLKTSLNKVGLESVIDIASRAGARSIDTEAERAYLAATTPGTDKDEDVNRNLLWTAKSVLIQARTELNAKKAWLDVNTDLEGYVSPLEGKKTYVNPKTNEIKFANPEGEIPKGFVPLSDRLAFQSPPLVFKNEEDLIRAANEAHARGDTEQFKKIQEAASQFKE